MRPSLKTLGLALALSALTTVATAGPTAKQPFRQAFIVILENTTAAAAEQQPYLSVLRQRGAYLAQHYGVTHPSQPNYIALVSGQTAGIQHDGKAELDIRHLGDLLEAKGKTWRVYAEGYPGGCFTGEVQGKYVRKHVPFLSFNNVRLSPARCANIVSADRLDDDVAKGKLADVTFYIPDQDNDGHDTGPVYADRWLKARLGRYLDNAAFLRDRLAVVTFDEDDYSHDNRIYTVLLGSRVQPGATVTERTDHYRLLKTLETGLGLGDLGQQDAPAKPIDGIWSSRGGK